MFSKNSNNVDVVICAIALNEERYIDEWIKYNLLLGFTHIYIYDNSANNILKDKKSDRVTIIPFPGITKQLEAYDFFADCQSYETKLYLDSALTKKFLSFFPGRTEGALAHPTLSVNSGKFLVFENSHQILSVNLFDLIKHLWRDIDR